MAYEKFDELAGLELDKVFNDARLGALNFEQIKGDAEKLKNMLLELRDYDFLSYLTKGEIHGVNEVLGALLGYIRKISSFNITESNASSNHNSIISNFTREYESLVQKIKFPLTNLKLELIHPEKLLSEQKKQLKRSSELNKQLEGMVGEIENKLTQLSQGSGTIGTTILHQEYDSQQPDYDKEKEERLSKGKIIFRALVVFVGITLLAYILLTIIGGSDSVKLIFNIEFGVLFAILVSLGFYGVSFCSRKYDIISNIANQNKHRSNVAKTFAYFLASGNQPYESILAEVARALFAHTDSGYITKKATEINSPLIEMITKQFNKDPS